MTSQPDAAPTPQPASQADPAAAHEPLGTLVAGGSLTEARAEAFFGALLAGEIPEAAIGAALALIQSRGPTSDELTGAARVMRRHVSAVPVGDLGPGAVLIDTCGTGGAPKTFNVSTAAAFVAAGATRVLGERGGAVRRVCVAKHGNRSRTGRGSAEVLAGLGVNIDASPEVQARCLGEAGVCFSFAIHHHPAMRYAMGPRRALGFPTIFNALGPMTNPAGATRQLIGVYDAALVPVIAGALARLGAERALVAHGLDGLDELTIDGVSTVCEVDGGSIREHRIDAQSLGLVRAEAGALRVDSVEGSVAAIRAILSNESDETGDGQAGVRAGRRDIVLLNAAAALVVAGAAGGIGDGLELARASIASGGASGALDMLARVSHGS